MQALHNEQLKATAGKKKQNKTKENKKTKKQKNEKKEWDI